MNEEQKILKYATDEFLENGFYKTTMDQLAKGMKISKKTIYKFFPSKSHLLEKVIHLFQNKIKEDLYNIADSDRCLITKLHDISTYIAKFTLKINKKLLFETYNHHPELWVKVDTFRASVIENVWEKILIQGKKEELIIQKPNNIIIAIILSSLTGVVNPKFLMENNLSANEAIKETLPILINGILTEKGKTEFEKQKWNEK